VSHAYIVVVGGHEVHDYASKKEAHVAGKAFRKDGKTAFAYSKKDAEKFGLDPREKGELSTWASKKTEMSYSDHMHKARLAMSKMDSPKPKKGESTHEAIMRAGKEGANHAAMAREKSDRGSAAHDDADRRYNAIVNGLKEQHAAVGGKNFDEAHPRDEKGRFISK
jgi:hypothetical protein